MWFRFQRSEPWGTIGGTAVKETKGSQPKCTHSLLARYGMGVLRKILVARMEFLPAEERRRRFREPSGSFPVSGTLGPEMFLRAAFTRFRVLPMILHFVSFLGCWKRSDSHPGTDFYTRADCDLWSTPPHDYTQILSLLPRKSPR